MWMPMLTVFISLQDPQERSQAEQVLRVFGQSTEYIAYCKARSLSEAPNLSAV